MENMNPDLVATMRTIVAIYNEDEPDWNRRPADWVAYANEQILAGLLSALESLTEEQYDDYDPPAWGNPIDAAFEVGQ